MATDPEDSVRAIWAELRFHLARVAGDLNAEIARYPTPIARCDEQLTELLERRARTIRQRQRADALEAMVFEDERRIDRLADFLATTEPRAGDDAGESLRLRLGAALHALALARAGRLTQP